MSHHWHIAAHWQTRISIGISSLQIGCDPKSCVVEGESKLEHRTNPMWCAHIAAISMCILQHCGVFLWMTNYWKIWASHYPNVRSVLTKNRQYQFRATVLLRKFWSMDPCASPGYTWVLRWRSHRNTWLGEICWWQSWDSRVYAWYPR